jgi:hypothetical protein
MTRATAFTVTVALACASRSPIPANRCLLLRIGPWAPSQPMIAQVRGLPVLAVALSAHTSRLPVEHLYSGRVHEPGPWREVRDVGRSTVSYPFRVWHETDSTLAVLSPPNLGPMLYLSGRWRGDTLSGTVREFSDVSGGDLEPVAAVIGIRYQCSADGPARVWLRQQPS